MAGFVAAFIVMLASIFVSLLTFTDGKINTRQEVINAAIVSALTAALAITIVNSLRVQGLIIGKKTKKFTEVYEKYIMTATSSQSPKAKRLRSQTEFLSVSLLIDVLTKGVLFALTAWYGFNTKWEFQAETFVIIIVAILTSAAMGLVAMIKARDFVIEELTLYYAAKTNKLLKEVEDAKTDIQRPISDVSIVSGREEVIHSDSDKESESSV